MLPKNRRQNNIMQNIYKPIFIVGVPRSGTTLVYEYLAMHKDLAWFSQRDFKDFFSKEYWEFTNLRRRIYGLRQWHYLGKQRDMLFRTSFEFPDEVGHLWNKWIGKKGWTTEDDITESVSTNLRQAVSNLLVKKNKRRFLNKNPAHSVRMPLLYKVFSDALFINIIRDGRAVVASMINSIGSSKRFEKYFGIALKNANQMEYDVIERHARQWVEVNEEIQNSKNHLGQNQYYEIKYEDFIQNPRKCLEQIFKFCELDYQDIFENSKIRMYGGKLSSTIDKLQSRNEKWPQLFSSEDVQRLENIMGKWLQRFEYS